MTFADDEPAAVSKAEVDGALRVAQEQEQVLRRLEREIARNKDYLQKVRVRSHPSLPTGLTPRGFYRQCEAGRRARARRTRPRTGLILRKSCGRVHLGVVGPTSRCTNHHERGSVRVRFVYDAERRAITRLMRCERCLMTLLCLRSWWSSGNDGTIWD